MENHGIYNLYRHRKFDSPLPDYIVPVRTGTGGQAGFRDGEITEFSAFFVVPQP
ncbi:MULTISPECIES: hypothetical protein [unclassified Arenibacter]|uniref:hypothetical protein n=1 Tax=unclassified Arenibacter TaxID=2615047 RepID=UPI0015F2AD08|nr:MULTISPECIES: hypothetical protein [unclassified Arenibacter]